MRINPKQIAGKIIEALREQEIEIVDGIRAKIAVVENLPQEDGEDDPYDYPAFAITGLPGRFQGEALDVNVQQGSSGSLVCYYERLQRRYSSRSLNARVYLEHLSRLISEAEEICGDTRICLLEKVGELCSELYWDSRADQELSEIATLDLEENPICQVDTADQNYLSHLRRTGASEIVGVRADGFTPELPEHIFNDSFKEFGERHKIAYEYLKEEYRRIIGKGIVVNWLENPVQTTDQLKARQTAIQGVMDLMNGQTGHILERFLELFNNLFFRGSDFQYPIDDEDISTIQSMLDMDFSEAFESIRALDHRFFSHIAQVLIQNERVFKDQWAGLLDRARETNLGQAMLHEEFNASQAMATPFSIFYLQRLAQEIGAYSEYMSNVGTLCWPTSGTNLSFKSLTPLLFQPRERGSFKLPDLQTGLTPLTLEIPQEKRVVILRGTNASGKSTTLRTIRLCDQLARAGLPIPVGDDEGSFTLKMGGVLRSTRKQTDIPEIGQSTFQCQIGDVNDYRGDHTGIVIIDEARFASDEPVQFLLDEYVRHYAKEGKLVIVVLQSAADRNRMMGSFTGENEANLVYEIHMGHEKNDGGALEPTYKIEEGQPSSEDQGIALQIAQKFGADPELTERARIRWLASLGGKE